MDYLIVCITALVASGLTLFSGFGLGTILLPAFALFFPIEAAVGMTAVVHLLNNVFKLALLGRHAAWGTVLRFGLPAVGAAFLGAWMLTLLADMQPLAEYELLGRDCRVTPVKLAMALLIAAFAWVDLSRRFERLRIPSRLLPLGGVLSGFFGGLSGHQGALRSAFLIKAGLSKQAFIATGVVIACLVDVARLSIYAAQFSAEIVREHGWLVGAATLAAFAGAWLGTRLLKKITLRHVQVMVAAMLMLIAAALGAGVI